MALERTKNIVNRKLINLGIDLSYRVCPLYDGESWSCDRCKKKHKHIVHLDSKDATSRMLAMQNLQHLLLHETGHIFLCTTVRKVKDPCLKKLFGDINKEYTRDMRFKHRSSDFISTYAQAHPEDNFCEVFAVYVGFCGDMQKIKKFLRQKKKSDKVLQQFIWMDKFVKKKLR